MKTRIVRIGNSQGIRIPKPLLEEAGLGDEVQLRLSPEGLVIERIEDARRGWSEAAARLVEGTEGGDDPFVPSDFDDEWEW